jgi:hypothetical protein
MDPAAPSPPTHPNAAPSPPPAPSSEVPSPRPHAARPPPLTLAVEALAGAKGWGGRQDLLLGAGGAHHGGQVVVVVRNVAVQPITPPSPPSPSLANSFSLGYTASPASLPAPVTGQRLARLPAVLPAVLRLPSPRHSCSLSSLAGPPCLSEYTRLPQRIPVHVHENQLLPAT